MLNLLDESYVLGMSTLLEKSSDKKSELNDVKEKVKSKKFDISSIKSAITKFLAHSPESLSSDVPTIMDIIQMVIVVGIPTAINPILAIPTLIANKVIRDSADEKVIGKYISQYNLEIENAKKKLEKETDESKKVFWKSYIKKLQEGRTNMMNKKEDLRDKSGFRTDLDESLDILEYEFSRLNDYQKASLFDESTMLDDIDDDFLLESGIVTDVKMKAKQAIKSVKDKAKSMDKWFNDTLKEIRDNARNEKRDAIVEENYPKLSKMIKKALALGSIAAVLDPIIAAITFVVGYTIKKKGDFKEKRRLLSELNNELEVCEAKIQDAEANGDKTEKYNLIRLRQKLRTSIDKVKGSI